MQEPPVNLTEVVMSSVFVTYPILSWLQKQMQLILSFFFRIMCSLRTPRPICPSTSGPTYRYVGRDVDRHIGRVVLVKQRSICRPIYRPLYRSRCQPMLDRYVSRHSGRHSADTLTVEYRSSVSGLSVECRRSIGRLSYNINQKFRLSVSKV